MQSQIPSKVINISRLTFVSAFRFIIKHWYLFVILFSILPVIISSFQIAYQTSNPTYPFAQLGITLFNADASIGETVSILKSNPEELLGVKPEKGFMERSKYFWNISLLAWSLLGKIMLISLPFALAYRYYKWQGQRGNESSKSQNFNSALKVGLIYMFVVNLILIVIGLIDGTLLINFVEGASIFDKFLYIVIKAIPFHGLGSLVLYIVSLFNA